MAQQAELEGRLVGKISGEFVVKSYKRGYRWGESQVNALLNDIYDNGQKANCTYQHIPETSNLIF